MIISTGMRTDIPAFYPEWLINRFREGYVLVRNPYYPSQVLKYELNNKVVDCITFCTKNPLPILKYLDELNEYKQFWFVTITPYRSDIEPNVLSIECAIDAFKKLSNRLGLNNISWRYDPIFYGWGFDRTRHINEFENLCSKLSGYTNSCVISFLEMYKKVEKNAPGIFPPSKEEQIELLKILDQIAKKYGIVIRSCMSKYDTPIQNIDMNGCQSKAVIENAIGSRLEIKEKKSQRQFCNCLLGNDIGAYNSCMHLCKYCYANYDAKLVMKNYKQHNVNSPLLIGNLNENDKIISVKQKSNISKVITLF